MKEYNYSKLLGRMRSKGVTQERLGTSIGRNIATVNQKLNGKSYFTQSEIDKICECLDIKPNEIPEYFFCSYTYENPKICEPIN